ncbi:MAG: 3'-5' exonuclease [Anaerolineales bacterium]|nr:3'-5' exonuclease [Anaerolineales bacterium]
MLPGERPVVQRIRDIWAKQPVFIDTETTGLNNRAEIVEICLMNYDGNILLESLVRPRKPIPMDVIRLHGITDDMVSTAPTWLQLWPQVESILRGRYVGAYNAEFDLRMMQQSHLSNGLPWRSPAFYMFCVMKLFSEFTGAYKFPTLEQAGEQCLIQIPNAHRAQQDTALARAVFLHMVNPPK